MNELMSKHTGQPVDQIERDIERDKFMGAHEAVKYGLIDTVISHRGDIPAEDLKKELVSK